jgi:hypothetical protein
MIVQRPICLECDNFHPLDHETMSCKAFISGIPDAIITSEHDHNKPFPGDNGIRFEQVKDFNNSNKRLK